MAFLRTLKFSPLGDLSPPVGEFLAPPLPAGQSELTVIYLCVRDLKSNKSFYSNTWTNFVTLGSQFLELPRWFHLSKTDIVLGFRYQLYSKSSSNSITMAHHHTYVRSNYSTPSLIPTEVFRLVNLFGLVK